MINDAEEQRPPDPLIIKQHHDDAYNAAASAVAADSTAPPVQSALPVPGHKRSKNDRTSRPSAPSKLPPAGRCPKRRKKSGRYLNSPDLAPCQPPPAPPEPDREAEAPAPLSPEATCDGAPDMVTHPLTTILNCPSSHLTPAPPPPPHNDVSDLCSTHLDSVYATSSPAAASKPSESQLPSSLSPPLTDIDIAQLLQSVSSPLAPPPPAPPPSDALPVQTPDFSRPPLPDDVPVVSALPSEVLSEEKVPCLSQETAPPPPPPLLLGKVKKKTRGGSRPRNSSDGVSKNSTVFEIMIPVSSLRFDGTYQWKTCKLLRPPYSYTVVEDEPDRKVSSEDATSSVSSQEDESCAGDASSSTGERVGSVGQSGGSGCCLISSSFPSQAAASAAVATGAAAIEASWGAASRRYWHLVEDSIDLAGFDEEYQLASALARDIRSLLDLAEAGRGYRSAQNPDSPSFAPSRPRPPPTRRRLEGHGRYNDKYGLLRDQAVGRRLVYFFPTEIQEVSYFCTFNQHAELRKLFWERVRSDRAYNTSVKTASSSPDNPEPGTPPSPVTSQPPSPSRPTRSGLLKRRRTTPLSTPKTSEPEEAISDTESVFSMCSDGSSPTRQSSPRTMKAVKIEEGEKSPRKGEKSIKDESLEKSFEEALKMLHQEPECASVIVSTLLASLFSSDSSDNPPSPFYQITGNHGLLQQGSDEFRLWGYPVREGDVIRVLFPSNLTNPNLLEEEEFQWFRLNALETTLRTLFKQIESLNLFLPDISNVNLAAHAPNLFWNLVFRFDCDPSRVRAWISQFTGRPSGSRPSRAHKASFLSAPVSRPSRRSAPPVVPTPPAQNDSAARKDAGLETASTADEGGEVGSSVPDAVAQRRGSSQSLFSSSNSQTDGEVEALTRKDDQKLPSSTLSAPAIPTAPATPTISPVDPAVLEKRRAVVQRLVSSELETRLKLYRSKPRQERSTELIPPLEELPPDFGLHFTQNGGSGRESPVPPSGDSASQGVEVNEEGVQESDSGGQLMNNVSQPIRHHCTRRRERYSSIKAARNQDHFVEAYFDADGFLRKSLSGIPRAKKQSLYGVCCLRRWTAPLEIRQNDKGRAVYAAAVIEKDDFLCEYIGDYINLLTVARMREKRYEQEGLGSFMFYFTNPYSGNFSCIDATEEKAEYGCARLINHSHLQPNCFAMAIRHPSQDPNSIRSEPKLVFIAKRRIHVGEEILIDYGETDSRALKANPWLLNT